MQALPACASPRAQLEAAERLAKSGALPNNQLLGLYTERLPAASGSIWDRVEAIQRLDTALKTGSAEAVSKTLPQAWVAAKSAELEVAFAGLFAADLGRVALTGAAADIAGDLLLLSAEYQAGAGQTSDPLLRAIATGTAIELATDDPLRQAVIMGFQPNAARSDLTNMAQRGHLGDAILRCLSLLDAGVDGDPSALKQALGTLLALGFEDTARRAALQILLLPRFG